MSKSNAGSNSLPRRRRATGLLALVSTMGLQLATSAQGAVDATQGTLELKSSVIAAGATRGTATGGWSLEGTVGQVDAFHGTASGGITLAGGFWPTAVPPASEVLFENGFE